MTRTASKDGTNKYLETQSEGKRYSFDKLIKMLYANLLAPVVVVLLFTHEVTGTFIVDSLGLDKMNWYIIRIVLVLCVVTLRFSIFREELQFQFDQSYYIISRMIQEEVEKTENTFRYVRSRVYQNFNDTWFTVFQQSTNFMLPSLLSICALHRIIMFVGLDSRAVEFDFSKTI